MPSGKRAETEKEKPENVSAALPLFFSKPMVITLERHAKAKVRGDITLAFAHNTNSIPLAMADIPEAAKSYPIVFTQDGGVMPVAIVGLEQQNYFVGEEGKWMEGHYVPSYVRKYPFVFVEDQNDKLTLCIDEASLTFGANAEGHALYEDGHTSAFTNNALEFCAAYQEDYRITGEFCKALEDKKLLISRRSDIELASGRAIQLNGFQIIETEKLKALPETTIVEWHQRGFLQMIYYIMQSTSNWGRLLDLANKNETAALTK